MGKKIVLSVLLLVFVMGFCACNEEKAVVQEPKQEATESVAGLAWPGEYMSALPEPDSKITSIDKLKGTETIAEGDTTTQPSSVNVVMNEMTMEQATAYYEEIKGAGFVINTDENDKDRIFLVGTLNDADANPFLFSYTVEDGFGNVSITIMKGI